MKINFISCSIYINKINNSYTQIKRDDYIIYDDETKNKINNFFFYVIAQNTSK